MERSPENLIPNPPNIQTNNADIPIANSGKLLDLNRRGVSTQAKLSIKQANITLAKPYRFTQCTTRTKIKLYKTVIRPILDYTPVSLQKTLINKHAGGAEQSFARGRKHNTLSRAT